MGNKLLDMVHSEHFSNVRGSQFPRLHVFLNFSTIFLIHGLEQIMLKRKARTCKEREYKKKVNAALRPSVFVSLRLNRMA